MASSFAAYITGGRNSDRVQDFTVSSTAGETSAIGEFALYDTTDNRVERCGADPALIGVFSEVVSENARAITDDGKCPFYKIEEATLFAFSSSTTPAESYVGDRLGMTRNSTTGFWQVDTAKTGTSYPLLVHSVDIAAGIFRCQIHSSFLQYSSDN